MKKLFLKLNQFLCKHDFKIFWKPKFGSLLFSRRYFEEDIKVVVCVKCKKIKQ